MSVEIPEEFRAALSGRPPVAGVSGDAWLRALPGLAQDALTRWELTPTARAGSATAPSSSPSVAPTDPRRP